MNRRDFLLATSVAAGGTAASGAAAAQQGNASGGGNETGGGNATGGNQSAGGNQSGGNATGGNATGGNATGGNATGGNATGGNQSAGGGGGGGSTTTVEVGTGSGTSFGPEEATIAPGSTIVWEWTGEGGAHNVVADDGAFNSGSPEEGSGITFQHTFQEAGEFTYHCAPHEAVGMVGTIVVQEGGASSGGGGGEEEVDPEEMGVAFQAHFVGIATLLMMVLSLIYSFFTLKYGESPNAKGGNN
ncbi:plastocyanin/azurin family copper-binding protein [Halococcus sp. PRR34]|uniref:plastocyanin/azurin family copper-binding protein n=1 Tax=Halococcus sp. PRR34 TaxID=3020830 RepID=UPI0023628F73|nr:plastocyanin/azurin family copper-binding protein [Halococcus sp. PRR34]